MATILEYSTTAGDNTTVGDGTSVAEGVNAGLVNNGMRGMMADIARLQQIYGGATTVLGSANALTYSTGTNISSYADGMMISFVAAADNTGAATLNVDTVGAKAIRKEGDIALVGGEIKTGGHYIVQYDASANTAAGAWLLINPTAGSVAFSGSEATITSVATDDVAYLEDTDDSGNGKKATIANILSTLLTSFRGLSAVAGDLFYATGVNTVAKLAKGTAGQVLTMNSGATAPEWAAGVDVRRLSSVWCNFNGTGTVAIRDSYNVTSLTDNGTGDYDINTTNNFDGTDYAATAIAGTGSGGSQNLTNVSGLAAGAFNLGVGTTSAAVDRAQVHVQINGDLA